MDVSTASPPKLSVTVLNYNYGHFLPTCLDSILGQTFKEFEVILINDKSTDNSLEVIQPYLTDSRVRLVDHKENKGFVTSLIEGCELSRGKYISVISADDWATDMMAFEKQIAVLEQNPETAFVYNAYGYYENELNCNFYFHPLDINRVFSKSEAFCELAMGRYPHHSGTMIRKSAYDAIGGYDPKLRYAVDAQLWLGLCHVGKVAYINEQLYAYRYHGANMSKAPEVVRKTISELLQILDWSYNMFSAAEKREHARLYKKAVRNRLTWYALDNIFQNNYRAGWNYYWVSVGLRPYETIVQKMTPILILRTVLGRHYTLIERLKASLGGNAKQLGSGSARLSN